MSVILARNKFRNACNIHNFFTQDISNLPRVHVCIDWTRGYSVIYSWYAETLFLKSYGSFNLISVCTCQHLNCRDGQIFRIQHFLTTIEQPIVFVVACWFKGMFNAWCVYLCLSINVFDISIWECSTIVCTCQLLRIQFIVQLLSINT